VAFLLNSQAEGVSGENE